MLTYADEIHEYRYGGAVVPHVTGILQGLVDFSRIDPEALERARKEGKTVHLLVETECKAGVDIEKLHAHWRPYLFAFRTFVARTGFKLLHSERKVYHPVYGYAGTLDLEGLIFGDDAIIDLKRSLYGGPVIGLQLAAYREARQAERYAETKSAKQSAIRKRYALRLLPERAQEPYQLTEFKDDEDFGVFLSLLKIQRWKAKYGRQ